jgi:levansucrase
MKKKNFGKLDRRKFMKTTAAAGATGLGLSLGSGSAAAVETSEADQWTRAEANKIELTDDTTAPVIGENSDSISDEYWIWDSWPLRNRDGSIVKINGWQIIFSLTASNDLVPGARHNEATIRYFYSRNGHDWQEGGKAFDNPLGHHQWAGSAMYDQDQDRIYSFYTAVSSQPDFRQRPALGIGASIETGPQGVELTGEQEHTIMGTPNGDMYQTLEQSRDQGILYAFRDPWYFQHPETGEDLVVFEANTPTGTDASNPKSFNGSIGAMKATNDDLTEWELLPPTFEAIGTNQQLERPHYVFNDGKWYLFTISHEFTFAPGLSGPDALYGFVSDSMYGDYEPLNDSGLVVANPADAPFQAYSWLAMPHNGNLVLESFENFRGLDNTSRGAISLDEVGFLPAEEQKELFGGTLAPSLKVQVDGTDTRVVSELQDGHFLPSVGSQSRGNGRGNSQ